MGRRDPRYQKQDGTLECAACHMTVMQRGDWVGWKPVALPGRQIWYCNKQPCQEQHDILLIQVQRGNLPAVLKVGQPGHLVEPLGVPPVQESDALRARIAELEAENAKLKGGQSTAPEPPTTPTAPAVEQVPAHLRPRPDKVHVQVDEMVLCGANIPLEETKKPEMLSFEDDVCDDCIGAFAKERERHAAVEAAARKARHEAYKRGEDPQAADKAAREAAEAASKPLPAPLPASEVTVDQSAYVQPLALPEPTSGIPEGLDYAALPKFDTNLISRVNDGAKIGGPILVTQATYPDIDFAKIRPGQLRNGLSGFFTRVEVDAIDRAVVDGEVVGMVFTLKEKNLIRN